MTIVYLIDYNPKSNSGVMQKIHQQSSEWIKEGHKVYLVSTKTVAIHDPSNNTIIYQYKIPSFKFGRLGTAFNLLISSFFLQKLLLKIDFDILYMRYRLYMPYFQKVLKQYKVIMEINSDDAQEYQLHSMLTHYYNKYTRNYLLKNVDAFVAVSKELKNRFEYLKKPTIVIANGIKTNEYEYLEIPQNQKPILVFIGTPKQPWHGLDKIHQMATYFPYYTFYIIGTDGINTDNIHYFGYLDNKEASKIIEQCDVGIGTLSLYKTGLTEASPLKTRQYLACGLPLIYAYDDTDIPSEVEFALKLQNSENNMNYAKIETFVRKIFKRTNIRKSAREFAINILDYSKKEKHRLDFFQKIINE